MRTRSTIGHFEVTCQFAPSAPYLRHTEALPIVCVGEVAGCPHSASLVRWERVAVAAHFVELRVSRAGKGEGQEEEKEGKKHSLLSLLSSFWSF